MRNLILCLALGAVASSAFALTNEDLAANTWMPLELSLIHISEPTRRS